MLAMTGKLEMIGKNGLTDLNLNGELFFNSVLLGSMINFVAISFNLGPCVLDTQVLSCQTITIWW